MLGCEKLICFGDEVNDIPMFNVADESYAVSNANQKLKNIATKIIRSNDEDGVARWLNSKIRIKKLGKNSVKEMQSERTISRIR